MTEKTKGKHETDVSRRNILLAGTTMAATSALAASAPMKTAQAQQFSIYIIVRIYVLVIVGERGPEIIGAGEPLYFFSCFKLVVECR